MKVNIEMEKNGYGKGYNIDGTLGFEGEYKNDEKWTGKANIREQCGIYQFEGEYINGNKTGKEKTRDSVDSVITENEYLNGEKHGKCKKYKAGILVYEEEYLNGKLNGETKKFDKDGNLIVVNRYLNGIKIENNQVCKI